MTTKLTKNNFSSLNTIGISWQSVITADGSTSTNAIAGQGYFIDTTSAAHTINLPSSPSIGDSIAITDYAGTFGTNNLTITRNGNNIQGVANDSLINTNRASIVLVYVDSTKGWIYAEESNVADLQAPTFITATGGTITTSGDYKIHSFTGDGCFVVTQLGNSPIVPTGGPSNVDYLVVAGGGGGGLGIGGGGGAGGYRTTFPSPGCNAGAFPISATTYPITVGGGGSGSTGNPVSRGSSGSDSVFSTITSTGGGRGAEYSPTYSALTGGSGGGGAGESTPTNTGAAGNTPPVSPSQGNPGGNSTPNPQSGGSGGGGAGASGSSSNTSGGGGAGGNGSSNSITGVSVTRSGGGGGGSRGNPGYPGGSGGTGGGGVGAHSADGGIQAGSGTANTGGGGGGSTNGSVPGPSYIYSGAGGKGIVIIRYKYQ